MTDIDETIDDVREASRRSGHLRILVSDADVVKGVVHVRDTLTAPQTLAEITRPAYTLEATTPVYVALQSMRETRHHLALVVDGSAAADDPARSVGVVTLSDVLTRLLPQPV